ncbi:MAG: oligopeptide transporter, OPT family [Candidatus Krumholzibacteriota bacterium]|nr:oligopeptide transporter, OPT family [Candidatus Krumholzibacteriota bacterium]
MADNSFKPYVPAEARMREFTVKAIVVGAVLSVILGAANAYLGLVAGMTVAATFPAAVMAMAVLRGMKGTILEENTCRTTAAVGEALVAGAIFTIPAFLIAKNPTTGEPIWDTVHYWESTLLMLVGGILGVLFVIFLRRVLIEDATLPFPESVACAEIVKAGQGNATGAKYVFGTIGLSAILELVRNDFGLQLVQGFVKHFWALPVVKNFQLLTSSLVPIGRPTNPTGGIFVESPDASPAMMGVGYIIGPKLAAIVFAGGVFGHMMMVPLFIFINGTFGSPGVDWLETSGAVWNSQVRPLAVGAMLVGAFYTLFKMRKSLGAGIARAFKDLKQIGKSTGEGETSRIEKDIPYSFTIIAIIAIVIPIAFLYYHFSQNLVGAIVSALVMTVAGFLFAAVAGFLVGTIGSSNNPISGLTLSTLIVAAILMVAVGVKGAFGIAAVLGVAAVVCCSSGVAGDIIQDLKAGHILGGTPRAMELGCMIGVVAAAFVMALVLQLLHTGYAEMGGIGGELLPAPQAGLMAMLSQGIITGQMAWPLVIMGALFSIALILIGAPSPMLIAVGMYLPFHTTFAIFIGGIIKWITDMVIAKRKLDKEKAENTGILLASGLIAGQALMGIIIAATVVIGGGKAMLPKIIDGGNPWLALVIFAIIGYTLIRIPIRSGESRES